MFRYYIFIFVFFNYSAHAKKLKFSPLKSAHQLMNIFYQNCQSSKIRPYDFKKIGELNGFETKYNPKIKGRTSINTNNNINQINLYLTCNQKKVNNFQTYLCQNPPSYLWDGKGIVNLNTIDIFHNESDIEEIAHHPGLDCSGFINLSFILGGLKVDSTIPVLDSAKEISAKDFMRPLSCFKSVLIENGEKTKSGRCNSLE